MRISIRGLGLSRGLNGICEYVKAFSDFGKATVTTGLSVPEPHLDREIPPSDGMHSNESRSQLGADVAGLVST